MRRLGIAHRLHRHLPKRGSLFASVLAVALVAAAVLLRLPLDQLSQGPLPPFITLYPAIVLAAFLGGIRVGLGAMLGSAIAAWALWLAPPAPSALTPDRIVTGAVFLMTGAITVLTSGLARMLLDELALAEQSRAQVARESVHRIKNLIAVVQAMSRKISASSEDVGAYRDRLDARLCALAIAQDVLIARDGCAVDLDQLVASALAPFLPNPRLDVAVANDAALPNEVITPLCMALYELATNSMKYGALTNPAGRVRLEGRQFDDRYILAWRETGLTPTAHTPSAGFGSQLVRSALSRLDGGSVEYAITSDSVSCVFSWPANPRQLQTGASARSV